MPFINPSVAHMPVRANFAPAMPQNIITSPFTRPWPLPSRSQLPLERLIQYRRQHRIQLG
ncbi:MAG: hypothetical protein JO011_18590 [Ktedonobacteraceae bacterium]|nr:hypothetical protein [Ktedonobacteraceae bacterium]